MLCLTSFQCLICCVSKLLAWLEALVVGPMDAVASSCGKGGFNLFYVILIWYNPTLAGLSSSKKKKSIPGCKGSNVLWAWFWSGKINSINTLALPFSTNAMRISLLQYFVNSQLNQLVIKFWNLFPKYSVILFLIYISSKYKITKKEESKSCKRSSRGELLTFNSLHYLCLRP